MADNRAIQKLLIKVVVLSFIFTALFYLNQNKTSLQTSAPSTQSHEAGDICFYGCPIGISAKNKIIRRSVYVLSNNEKTKFADWVAYTVSDETIGNSQKRVWKKDPDLPDDETLSPSDYRGAREALRVDRGHQVPLASLTGRPDWETANDLSNITPQATDLNEGAWEHLENAERSLVKQDGLTVHSVTGPLYEADMPSLPHAHLYHKVPSGYWKVIAVEQNDKILTSAFIMQQNTPREADFCSFAVTIDAVERRAHLNFFPNLPQDQQVKIQTAGNLLNAQLGCK